MNTLLLFSLMVSQSYRTRFNFLTWLYASSNLTFHPFPSYISIYPPPVFPSQQSWITSDMLPQPYAFAYGVTSAQHWLHFSGILISMIKIQTTWNIFVSFSNGDHIIISVSKPPQYFVPTSSSAVVIVTKFLARLWIWESEWFLFIFKIILVLQQTVRAEKKKTTIIKWMSSAFEHNMTFLTMILQSLKNRDHSNPAKEFASALPLEVDETPSSPCHLLMSIMLPEVTADCLPTVNTPDWPASTDSQQQWTKRECWRKARQPGLIPFWCSPWFPLVLDCVAHCLFSGLLWWVLKHRCLPEGKWLILE